MSIKIAIELSGANCQLPSAEKKKFGKNAIIVYLTPTRVITNTEGQWKF